MNSSATLLPPVRRRSFLDLRIGLAFLAGCATGSALTGAGVVLLGALASPIPSGVRVGLAVALTLVVLAASRGLWGLRLPQTEHQIPASVVALRLPSRAWRFAVTYGTGLFTYLPSAAPHVLLVWLVLAAPSHWAILGAVAFGVGRGLDLLLRSCSTQRLAYEDSFQRITQVLRPATPLLVAALAAVAVVGA